MKKLLKLFLFLVVLAAGTYFGVTLYNSDLLEGLKPTVFETGSYTDYYYLSLDDSEKKAYTAVRESISELPEKIEVPQLDKEQLSDVLTALINDLPKAFMLGNCTLTQEGSRFFFQPNYKMTKPEYEALLSRLEETVDKILSEMPDTSDYDRELFFHDYIINNCTYSNTGDESEADVTGVFFDGRAKCSGYSKAMKLLLNSAGIDSILVTGVASDFSDEPQNHMWNAVKIDGQWYFADVTWDDPVTDSGEDLCRYVFLNMSEKMLGRTHSEYSITISCDSEEMYYYNVKGSLFDSFDEDTVKTVADLIANDADSGGNQTQFMFASSQLADKAVKKLFDGEKIYRALELADLKTERKIDTKRISYMLDEEANLVTIIFNTRD